ncbi:MAG TPA: hypothetical protein VKY73_14420 [Polyangiaceae bacterium]|nr:hypothetical protein [Polyangiaceae bacterium]
MSHDTPKTRDERRLGRRFWLGVGALLAVALGTTGCMTYRAYRGDARPSHEVATVFCDTEGVIVSNVDDFRFSTAWSEFEVLPGEHEITAELYWHRLERVIEGPKRRAKFKAVAGGKYVCVFDVDETKTDWSLSIVPEATVSWETRAFHGARSWRTPDGQCMKWDPKLADCPSGPKPAAAPADEEPSAQETPDGSG